MRTIPDSEFQDRIEHIQKRMVDERLDMIITFGDEAEPQYVRYFSDYWPSFETAAVFIPSRGKPVLLIGPESYTFARAWSKLKNIKRMIEYRESSEPKYPGEVLSTFEELFGNVINTDSFKRVGIVGYPLMPAPIYSSIKKTSEKFNCELIRAEQLIIDMKQIKSRNELEIMKEAASISEKAFTHLLDTIKPGMTEIQVVGEAQKLIRDFGAEGEAYPMWCISGTNTTQAIARPTHKEIREGELIQIQVGARLGGYASSFGRPIVLGKAAGKIIDFMNIGLEAHKTVINSLKANVNASEIDTIYRKFLTENGAEKYMLYGPCHGTGLMEGEHPWIEKDSNYLLEENMTFCVDNFLKTENYGQRWEDVVRITEDGVEEFTTKYQEVLIIE